MNKRVFLDQVSDKKGFIVEGFITQVYSIFSYYCKKCRKFSDKMCECGSFPEPIFRINGAFSDGTGTLSFITKGEDIAEKLSGVKKSDARNLDPKKIMAKPHTIGGYIRGKKLYITRVIE